MDSSRRMCALTAGWVRSRRLAVLVKLPSSQIATNVRNRSVGILILPEIADSLPPATTRSCCQLSCITLPPPCPCRRAFHGGPLSFYHCRGEGVQGPSRSGAMGRGANAQQPKGRNSLHPVTPGIDQRHGRAGQDDNGSNRHGVEHRDEAPAQESAGGGAEEHDDRLGP